MQKISFFPMLCVLRVVEYPSHCACSCTVHLALHHVGVPGESPLPPARTRWPRRPPLTHTRPAFPAPTSQTLLVEILSSGEFHSIIRWNHQGSGFIISSIRAFEGSVLLKKYKHAHYSSFLRSLSYYGFTRAAGTNDSCEYTHGVLHRDHPERICTVRVGVGAGARARAARCSAPRTFSARPAFRAHHTRPASRPRFARTH